MNVLLLCDYRRDIASTVVDHIDAISQHSKNNIRVLSMLRNFPKNLELERFDIVIIHYTLIMSMDSFVSSESRARLRAFKGLKAAFIQDEYRFVDRTIAAMLEIGIELLFTCVPESQIEKVYSRSRLPGMTKVNVLTGYVPDSLLGLPMSDYSSRKIDVGYRSRDVPEWLGQLGREKTDIGRRFNSDAFQYGLTVDISTLESDRIYGSDWIAFIRSCKAVLGVESGASVFDFSGEIQTNVESHKSKFPDAGFNELRDLYFKDQEGLIDLSQISPRCFEAAALGAMMILYEGDYSGVLVPWRHYVPLKKDHSNMAEVVRVIQDESRAMSIIKCAREEVAENERWSYKAFAEKVDSALDACFHSHHAAALAPYSEHAFAKTLFRARVMHAFEELPRRMVVAMVAFVNWFLETMVPVKYHRPVMNCLKWVYFRVAWLFGRHAL